jgi:trehalose 6-phosphate synthase/phosphatase
MRGRSSARIVEEPAGAQERGSIVVVSNRLPVTLRRTRGKSAIQRSSGGLVAALDPALREIRGTWVGWPGSVSNVDAGEIESALGYAVRPVVLSAAEARRYYCGFSNQTLWPLFHSLTGRVEVSGRDWKAYEAVNERFAAAADEAARPGDLIWIHDYHLLRVGTHLRERMPEAARLAFFLHIPFPPHDIFAILPWAKPLLEGMLSCDLVGFHCDSYASNFFDCVERLLGARVDRVNGRIEYGRRTVRAAAFPLGIDFDAYEAHAREAARERAPQATRVVLGVDRLDYTKGIPERIRAFERLLELHKGHRGKVTLVQLAVPSRAEVDGYQSLKREIDELVGRVNGRFATPTWTPIRYLYRSVAVERLAAMYRDADVALITPLRDGMNLVAKEYVACQVDDPGTLVLSRFAGAAESMPEALLVNPYDVDGVASALHRALCMRPAERASRIERLRRRERGADLHAWLRSYLGAVAECAEVDGSEAMLDSSALLGDSDGKEVAIFLDYDGTLAPIVAHPSEAGLSAEMAQALTECAARPDTRVVIVSGRALDDLRKRVPRGEIGLIGNHGFEVSVPGLSGFEHPDLPHYRRRLAELAGSLREILVPGAWVEDKGLTLTLHLRAVDPQARPALETAASECIARAGFHARTALCALEARPPVGWDKGQAVLHILRGLYGPAWSQRVRVIYAGDDETDEDAFRALSGLAATFGVGPELRNSRAAQRLAGVASVRALLEWFARRPQR